MRGKDWKEFSNDELLNDQPKDPRDIARLERIMNMKMINGLGQVWAGLFDLKKSLHVVAEQLEARMVAAEAAAKAERDAQAKRQDAEAKRQRLSVGVALLVALLTSVYVVFAGMQSCTMSGQLREMQSSSKQADRNLEVSEKSMTLAQRAWIAPRGISLSGPLTPRLINPLRFSYDNVGREPALNVRYTTKVLWRKVDVTRSDLTQYLAGLDVGPNVTCNEVRGNSGTVAYPNSGTATGYYSSALLGDVNLGTTSVITGVVTGSIVLFVQGCFIYETLGKVRQSAFCMYLEPTAGEPAKQWPFKYCSTGNFAD